MKWKILFVETTNSLMLKRLLGIRYDLIEADTVSEAIAAYRADRYIDLILADYEEATDELPGLNGLDAVDEIFEICKERQDTPPRVILRTDSKYDDRGIPIEYRVEGLGIDGLFPKKNIGYNLLFDRLEELLPDMTGIPHPPSIPGPSQAPNHADS
jgi:CheY-like chemotaxis protein